MDNSPHILIVDDDEYTRDSIDFILQSARFLVSSARNLGEAPKKIQLAESQGCPVQLVIIDLQMPVSGGLALLEELQHFRSYYALIAISAYGDTELRTGLRERGCAGYLDKPFNDQQLIQAVTRGLKKKNHSSHVHLV